MSGKKRIVQRFGLICLLSLSVHSLRAQELSPNDILPGTDDSRCVEENYHHKTDKELGSMTVEQLIDEKAKEWNYHVSLMDRYDMFTLSSYTDRIGTPIIPVLQKVAQAFSSRPLSKCTQERFFTAFAIASDVDQQVVRLRSTKEGIRAIAAAEAAIGQMVKAGLSNDTTHPYNKYHFGLYLLDSVQGTNGFDDDIRKLLSSNYRINLSDKQFVEFVNFLTVNEPTYPSWTPRINMGRDLQRNKEKYYAAFRRFKKTRGH